MIPATRVVVLLHIGNCVLSSADPDCDFIENSLERNPFLF